MSDLTGFLRLEPEWNETVDRAGIEHPFMRHEWLLTWWECFGLPTQRLHIVVARAQGRIVAIAPLLRESTRMYGVPIRRLRTLDNDHTPRFDFIVADRAEEAYRAIWRALNAASSEWDLVQINQIPRGAPTLDAVAKLAIAGGCRVGLWHGERSPYLPLQGTWADYTGALRPKLRQTLRNRLSRLVRLGEPVALEAVRQGPEMRAAQSDAFRLEASGWKQGAGTAITSDRAVHRFYSLLLDRASARGWLELLFLTVKGRRIATSLTARYRDRVFFVKTGYDPAYEKCAPFKILTSMVLKDAFDAGLVEVDFMGDAEPWKLEWTGTTRPHDWLFVFPDKRRSRLLQAIKFQVVPALKRWRG